MRGDRASARGPVTCGLQVLPLRLFETSAQLREELVYLRDRLAMHHGGEVDERAPVLPGTDVLVLEVEVRSVVRGSGDG